MVKVNKNSRRRCKICSVSFDTHSEMARHCLDASHQTNQCCRQCIKWFPTKQALAQHNSAKHKKSTEALKPQSSIPNASTTISLFQYQFKDKSYKHPPLLDSSVIYERLVLKRHSPNRLKKEGYILQSGLSQGNREDSIAPYPSSLKPKRKAVALDCEMAGARNGKSEIISICVIDFFSGQILINSFVKPHQPIIEWRTNIHGIRPATLSTAASKGQVLRGWQATRQELFKYINTDTILVGQSLQRDLKGLRVLHGKIFDTAIHTAEMVFGTDTDFGRLWSLQSLCSDLLGLRIRQDSSTHEALEDSMAAREVALWCLSYPDNLEEWGKMAREKYIAEKLERSKGRRKKRRNAQRSAHIRKDCNSDRGYHYDYGYDDDELRWEDVIDWEMWPKSPPSD